MHMSLRFGPQINFVSGIIQLAISISGNEYPAVVEYAPYTRVPKRKNKKPDMRIGTIENG